MGGKNASTVLPSQLNFYQPSRVLSLRLIQQVVSFISSLNQESNHTNQVRLVFILTTAATWSSDQFRFNKHLQLKMVYLRTLQMISERLD